MTDTKETYPVERQFCLKGELWPFPTLHRYHYMLDQEAALRENDYLFYLDVDTLSSSMQSVTKFFQTDRQAINPKPTR